MQSQPRNHTPDDRQLIKKAVRGAAQQLGLTLPELASVIGGRREQLSRASSSLGDKQAELALLVIRAARSLAALVDGDDRHMKHWVRTTNHHLQGETPLERMQSVQGLVGVVAYLDAMRGKV